MEPAAISARPAVTMMLVELTAPESPAASAKGTVRPSDMPMTISRTVSPAVKCCSTCGVWGITSAHFRKYVEVSFPEKISPLKEYHLPTSQNNRSRLRHHHRTITL